MKPKVLLGMSGGVDSSVSAILLKEQGYDVIGITMILCKTEDIEDINNINTVKDAKAVCKKLQIPHYTIDLRKEFNKYVIDNFINTYKEGKTPNPCIECNRYLKFGLMYEKAKELGCEYIATGHYATIEFSKKYNQYILQKAKSEKKDQSYFLYYIPKDILQFIKFPLNNFDDKQEIRKIAEAHGLEIAKKPDSQEICFIPDNDYANFLKQNNCICKIGNIITKDGEVLGQHEGTINYTIGQRKGLGVSYKEPLFVTKIDTQNNNIIVGTKDQIYSKTLQATDLNFLIDIDKNKPIDIKAKIRYRAKQEEAILTFIDEKTVNVEFENEVKSITPGQSVVFYIDNDIVLGGGKII